MESNPKETEDRQIVDKLSAALVRAAAESFSMEVGDQEKNMIGPGKRFASRQDWIDKRIDAWLENKPFEMEEEITLKTAYEWRQEEIKRRLGKL